MSAAASAQKPSSIANIRSFSRLRELTGRPVKWVADRSEHFVADTHGRDNVTKAGMALNSRGKFLALRLDIIGNLGAYAAQFGPYIHWLGATMATGPYHIPALHVAVRGVYTHTVPIDAYRGAGRPEAAYVLERLVDQCARALNMKRDEIRLLNFVTPEQMPYATLTGRRYDVGDFGGAMKRALENAEWDGFEARAEAAKSRNKLAGIGFASYIECTAWGEGENGSVELAEGGTFVVRVGTQSNGQGHATAYAQVVSHHLGVPLDKVRVLQGDTAQIPTGGGTSGSRSIPVGAAMISKASARLADQLKDLAADRLEAAKSDLEIAGAAVRVIGTDREILVRRACGASGQRGPSQGERRICAGRCHLSQRHARVRSRDRSGNGRDWRSCAIRFAMISAWRSIRFFLPARSMAASRKASARP